MPPQQAERFGLRKGQVTPARCDHGVSSASFYKWRATCGGMDASMISEMMAMAEENKRLKRMYAEMTMQFERLKSIQWIDLAKQWLSLVEKRTVSGHIQNNSINLSRNYSLNEIDLPPKYSSLYGIRPRIIVRNLIPHHARKL